MLTIGVDDLDRALRFYRDGLGLITAGVVGAEFGFGAVVFFDLQPGLKLAQWPRASISRDSGLGLAARSATEFTIGHNVSSREEVDAVMEQAKAAAEYVLGHLGDQDRFAIVGMPADVAWQRQEPECTVEIDVLG